MGTFNIDGMLSAKRTIFYTTDNSVGTTANLTLRTNGDNDLAPSLVFSIDGVKHSAIKMFSDGHFRFFNSSSSGYRNIYANTFIGNLSGNANTATSLQSTRSIFGQSFNGTSDILGHAYFYGSYNSTVSNRYATGGIEIRENDLVLTNQSDLAYAPSIGFHWGGRCAGSLIYDSIFYFKTQSWTRASIDANLIGTATLANKLSATRYIFGQAFDGSGDVQGIGTFYGPYGDPRGIVIREADLSTTGHNSNAAAPTLNFLWSGKYSGTLFMNSSGDFYLQKDGNRAYLDANVPYASSADIANSATSATYSTYAGTTWVATCQGLKWRRICYVTTDVGAVGTSGILNVRATRGNFVVNASFMICSSHSHQCSIVQLSSTSYSNVQIRGVVDSSGNFYIELYDDQVSIASGTNQSYYCSWLPLTRNSITVYTGATSGSTVPSGFAVSSSFRTAPGPYVVGNFVTHNFGSTLPSSAPYGAIFYKT